MAHPITVNPDVGGSYCVIRLGPDHYIDSRKDFRRDRRDVVHLEAVRNGQVYLQTSAIVDRAPEYMLRMVRNFLRYGSCSLEDYRNEVSLYEKEITLCKS